MNTRKRFSFVGGLATGMVALPLVLAGPAAVAEDENAGYPSTQSPLQVIEAAKVTLDNAMYSLTDALNGDNRPGGADGDESEFPELDSRLVEGPLGGLLMNGPLE